GLGETRPTLAVDIPSGVDASTGAILGRAVRADLTATFGLPKLGHVLFPGAERAGRLVVVDIGIPEAYVSAAGIPDAIVTRGDALGAVPDRPRDAHKGTFGHLLVVAGSPGKTGAAAMCAQAAMRVGTGLVTLAAPESVVPVLAAKLTEVMCEAVAETDARTLGRKAIERISALSEGKSALALGPGLSTHPETAELVLHLARTEERPLLLDADALNALAGRPAALENCPGPRVLTPHPGEMGRLCRTDAKRVNGDRIGTARDFARTHGVIVVLKGAHTVIAAPDGEARVNLTGNPGMASGGMGDALSGVIAGFLAQGVRPFEAACLGVYLHGLAGDLAARARGRAGLLATDVIDTLPRTIDALLAGRADAPF
ncbi:MAG: NAD(P)H-hydrate dehydratase, partial [Myxococcota bacterium]